MAFIASCEENIVTEYHIHTHCFSSASLSASSVLYFLVPVSEWWKISVAER